MALEYELEIEGSPLRPHELIELLQAHFGLVEHEGMWRTPTVSVAALPDEDDDDRVSVRFRLDKENQAHATRTMLVMVGHLLRQPFRSAELLFNGDDWLLEKRGGQLRLRLDDDFWTSDLRALVDAP